VIEIPAEVRDAMVVHANASVPNEACGLLAGSDGRAERFYPIRNTDQSPMTYNLDHHEHQLALEDLEQRGLEVVGIFHSHTHTQAYPSKTDVEKSLGPRRFYPNVKFLIVSLADSGRPDLRAFTIADDGVHEQEVRIA
jgi:proteasome lid subunit RPN8/RPN11